MFENIYFCLITRQTTKEMVETRRLVAHRLQDFQSKIAKKRRRCSGHVATPNAFLHESQRKIMICNEFTAVFLMCLRMLTFDVARISAVRHWFGERWQWLLKREQSVDLIVIETNWSEFKKKNYKSIGFQKIIQRKQKKRQKQKQIFQLVFFFFLFWSTTQKN